MIRFSVASTRGCFGGCSFCAITLHQGRIVQSRSEESDPERSSRTSPKSLASKASSATSAARPPTCTSFAARARTSRASAASSRASIRKRLPASAHRSHAAGRDASQGAQDPGHPKIHDRLGPSLRSFDRGQEIRRNLHEGSHHASRGRAPQSRPRAHGRRSAASDEEARPQEFR